ncbi:MAG: T9SS type A sorting domain-containing protein [Ignavibacteriaceae bacterium]
MLKRILTISILFVLFFGNTMFSQSLRSRDISPNLISEEIKPGYPITEAIWDVQYEYDALTVTGAAGNAAAIYLPDVNEFWTSRWASALLHRWTSAGALIEEFSVAGVTGVRSLTYDGTFLYAGQNTTSIAIIDPATKTLVGTITAPQTVRYITYDPTADGGSGGFWIGNFSTNPQLISMTGAVLSTLTYANLGTTSIYGAAWDGYSAGGPYVWFWGQGTGAGLPQVISQVSVATGLATGVTHDVITDVGAGDATALAGGLFITEGLVSGYATIGGLKQGTPDELFGYELAQTGAPCPVQPATNPSPANGTTGVSINSPGTATWTNGAGTTQVEVFFGPAGNVVSVYSGTPITSLAIPSPLEYSTTYQWRVVCKNDTCSGAPVAVWSFTTEDNPNLVTLFDEDFEAGAGDWTITNDGGTCVFTVAPITQNGYTLPATAVGSVLSADADFCGSGSTLLSTATLNNPIDASLYETVTLEFDNDWQAIDADDFSYVEVSIDGGTTWTAVRTFDVTDVRNTHEVLDISSVVALSSFNLRLRTIQPGWDWWWAVDNIKVIATDVVPVELTSFVASVNETNVSLSWSTATELNNSGFQVERSNGSAYEVVGFVAGHGTTTDIQNYNFVDQNVVAGSYNYRLKQVDFDGRFEYSNTIEVEVLGVKEFALNQNYPNPFNPSTTINFSLAVDSKVSLKIFDVLGQEVATLLNGQLAAGSQKVSFNASSLNSGVYFYRIDADGVDGQKFSSTKKMILTK